ncbi:unnamed protein product [Pleuronectes platessa]|uniref:Uncharacterized protein n=1 Tax=Pleuronectes platessa TaxID=8262 RepID=A0A9N7YCY8_PLEPL|nr:unnamed protein product [Pleuronectes platessa]
MKQNYPPGDERRKSSLVAETLDHQPVKAKTPARIPAQVQLIHIQPQPTPARQNQYGTYHRHSKVLVVVGEWVSQRGRGGIRTSLEDGNEAGLGGRRFKLD